MATRLLLLVAAAALTIALPGAGHSRPQQSRTLIATVGANDAFTITLADAAGRPVTQLPAGTYTIRVRDLSEIHNFHLVGPGVDMRTSVPERGETTWTVTLRRGGYTYVCDPHRHSMRGAFVVASSTPPRIAVSARMSARQETGPPAVKRLRATGVLTGTLTRLGKRAELRWRLTYRRTTGRVLAAHIHVGRPGRNGPIVAALCAPCRSGMRAHTILTARATRAVLRGGAYVNLHTRKFRAGEVRGQLRVRR